MGTPTVNLYNLTTEKKFVFVLSFECLNQRKLRKKVILSKLLNTQERPESIKAREINRSSCPYSSFVNIKRKSLSLLILRDIESQLSHHLHSIKISRNAMKNTFSKHCQYN